MNDIRVAVMAPVLGHELSFLSDVDPSVAVIDLNDILDARLRDEQGQRDRVDALLSEAEVLVIGYPVPRTLAARAPRLRWAHHTQAGASNLVGTDLWDSDVLLTSSRGYVATSDIAAYVLAGALHFGRGLHEAMRQKAARKLTREGYALHGLERSTMGIVGLGGIGSEVARLARGVGMRVVATRRSVNARAENVGDADLLLPPDDLGELAARSDFLAICAQLTAETRGMIGASVLEAMKPSAVVINVARGELLDEDALISALKRGQISGAVLDVYAGELDGAAPRRELIELPQVILTPHISGRGDPASVERQKEILVENLRRYVADRPLLNVVDRELGY